MAKKIRVYELARELGMTNAETLDVCAQLGVGVKSHSSSMEDAHADRVRRKAEREGLTRDEQPEEPAPAKKAPAKKKAAAKKAPAKKAPAKKAPAKKAPAKKKAAAKKAPAKKKAAEDDTGATAEQEVQEVAPPADQPDAVEELVETAPVADAGAAAEDPTEAPLVETAVDENVAPSSVDAVPSEEPSPPATKRVVQSSGRSGPRPPVAPAEPVAPAPKKDDPAPPRAAEPDAPASPESPEASAEEPPTSMSGKAIPPPPGPPTSASGKPIPPPPGQGGRKTAPPPSAGPRRSTAGTGGPSRNTGGPRTQVPGAGAPPGGGGGAAPSGGRPGGGRPGGGPGGRRPPRRKSRRRRNREELQPMDVPAYTPEDTEVPSGEIVVERASSPLEVGPKLNRTAADVVRFLMQQGEMVTATQSLNDDMIELFAAEVGAEIRLVDPGEEQEVELQKLLGFEEVEGEDDDEVVDEDWPARPPVITVMGHVDHGKTKLLDQIRSANVIDGEAGGITQHIGAYQASHQGQVITFLDTPGHEAFTAMRARGATATDIVVLVVAADDGVMPQTIEAIHHARSAEVPIVVAVNKIDRDNADPQRVLQQLSEHELIPESWGGDVITVELSALQNIGVDDLLDNLLVVSEVENLRADTSGRAKGVVLESHLDIGRGPVASVLVQSGTLSVGDPMVAGAAWGRVRALINDHGEQVKTAGPSTPVEVLGLSDVCEAGDEFVVAPSEKVASRVADTREHWHRQSNLGRDSSATAGGAKLEDIFKQIQAGEAATLNLILKADVNGSLEAVTESLRKLEREDMKLAFVHRGVGGITENDIQLAAASNATILGFNVRPNRKAREMSDAEQVEIRTYEIIYKLLEDIEAAMLGMLAPEFEEVVTGEAEVREVFRVPRIGAVAGCLVQSGVITRGTQVRFLREGTIIWKGDITSLKRFKDDVREVQAGYECGIGLSDFQDLKEGDIIETFEERELERT